MNWYYVENGQQAGPVDDAQLDQLHATGKVSGDTLIWREGMTNWLPYNQARPAGGAAAPAPGLRIAGSAGAGSAGAGSGGGAQVTCTQCGGVFPVEDTIRYGTVHVCANCKPAFMQKLAEGAKLQSGGLEYASMGNRFGAFVLDNILVGVVGTALQFGLAPLLGTDPNNVEFGLLWFILTLAPMVLAATYETVMVGAYGATLGKMACKIRVVTADGGRVSYGRALGRYFAKILSQIICLIGYLMALFDKEERRALHDRICNTRVVAK